MEARIIQNSDFDIMAYTKSNTYLIGLTTKQSVCMVFLVNDYIPFCWVCISVLIAICLLPNNILTLSWPCQVYSGHWKSNLLHLSLKVTNFPFAGMRCNSNCHNGQMINLCVVPFFIQTIMAWISLIFFENISFFFHFLGQMFLQHYLRQFHSTISRLSLFELVLLFFWFSCSKMF